jgi:hypothetical protein
VPGQFAEIAGDLRAERGGYRVQGVGSAGDDGVDVALGELGQRVAEVAEQLAQPPRRRVQLHGQP